MTYDEAVELLTSDEKYAAVQTAFKNEEQDMRTRHLAECRELATRIMVVDDAHAKAMLRYGNLREAFPLAYRIVARRHLFGEPK